MTFSYLFTDCFFDGKYYPVDSTMHIDEGKCFVVKCIKSNGRGPPTAQINDFGTNCELTYIHSFGPKQHWMLHVR